MKQLRLIAITDKVFNQFFNMENKSDVYRSSLLSSIDSIEKSRKKSKEKQIENSSPESMMPSIMKTPVKAAPDEFNVQKGSLKNLKRPSTGTMSRRRPNDKKKEISLNREELTNQSTFLNKPHESLECPPLNFFLKKYPIFLRCFDYLYRIRWNAIIFPLQRRVPFSKKFRKVCAFMTCGELLLVVPFFSIFTFGMITSFLHPSVSHSGHMARLPLTICFLTATHNSLFTMLTGIPFERALKYHKLSGILAFVNGIFHTYVCFVHPTPMVHPTPIVNHNIMDRSNARADDDNATSFKSSSLSLDVPIHTWYGSDPNFFEFIFSDQFCLSGTLLVIVISSMIVTSLPPIRKFCFELFYYLHVIFALVIVVCAFYHSGTFVPILVGFLWGGDLIIRKIFMPFVKYPRKATIRTLSETVTEVSFPKTDGFSYNPGQYVFLAVPELSIFQWHPFSISSSPHQHMVTIYIRKRGYWTSKLFELTAKKSEVTIWMEGPYGSLGVDLFSDRYKMIMFLSGGIGVTPMQSICQQLIYEHEEEERDLKKLWFIWTARDPELIENMDISRHSISIHMPTMEENEVLGLDDQNNVFARENEQVDKIECIDSDRLAKETLTKLPMSNTPDEEIERDLPLDDFEEDDFDSCEQELPLNTYETPSGIIPQKEAGISPDSIKMMHGRDREAPLHSDVCPASNENRCITTEHKPVLPLFESAAARFRGEIDDNILQLFFFLTDKEMQEYSITEMLPVKRGRPNLEHAFLQLREEAILLGEKRVAICVCAPKRLTDICRKACVKFSNRDVKFDFHSEVFN